MFFFSGFFPDVFRVSQVLCLEPLSHLRLATMFAGLTKLLEGLHRFADFGVRSEPLCPLVEPSPRHSLQAGGATASGVPAGQFSSSGQPALHRA